MNYTDTKFFDTNILCYALDSKDISKKQTAENIIASAVNNGSVHISTQVLQEMCSVAIKKLDYTNQELQTVVEYFSKLFNVCQISVSTIKTCLDISSHYQLSFWDSLIIASAIDADCDTLYTEDLNNGQIVEGLKIVNPFI